VNTKIFHIISSIVILTIIFLFIYWVRDIYKQPIFWVFIAIGGVVLCLNIIKRFTKNKNSTTENNLHPDVQFAIDTGKSNALDSIFDLIIGVIYVVGIGYLILKLLYEFLKNIFH